MKRNIQFIAGVCLFGLMTGLFTSCTDSMPEREAGTGELVECTFRLNTGTPVSVETRATDMSMISDVWVVQLNNAGTAALVAPARVVPDASKAINVKLKDETSKIYFFANTGNTTFFDTEDALSSFTTNAVEGKTITRTSNWGNMSYVPMYGTWTGKPTPPEITDADGNAAKVELTRALAQVSATVTNSTGGKLTISTMQLKNVPNVLKVAPTESGTYPATSGTYLDYPTTSSLSATWLVAENCRGTGSGRYETEKTAAAVTGGDKATYLEIKGTYNGIGATYRFYLGGNNTNDYNVKRNTMYTVGITISGKNRQDARLTMDAYPLSVSSGSGVAWGDGSNTNLTGSRN